VDPIVLAGLGNPGKAYAATRHNIGFRVLDEVARRCAAVEREGNDNCLLRSATASGVPLLLCAPLTYMNNSGAALAWLLHSEGVPVSRLLVIVDDLAIPLGRIRLRGSGSDGGHNGLASVIRDLGTDLIARLRCGIGQPVMPSGDRMAEFVLSPFEAEERPVVDEMVDRGAAAALEFATGGLSSAMNKYSS
jgi:PTH1 family peptidyl-tRNA hydrolase